MRAVAAVPGAQLPPELSPFNAESLQIAYHTDYYGAKLIEQSSRPVINVRPLRSTTSHPSGLGNCLEMDKLIKT